MEGLKNVSLMMMMSSAVGKTKFSLCIVMNKPKQASIPQTMGGRHTKSGTCLAQGRFWARRGQLSRRANMLSLQMEPYLNGFGAAEEGTAHILWS